MDISTRDLLLKKLQSAKNREKKARQQRISLTAILNRMGVDVNGSKARESRNRSIYRKYQNGVSFIDIAETVDISAERCKLICMRQDVIERKKKEVDQKAKTLSKRKGVRSQVFRGTSKR